MPKVEFFYQLKWYFCVFYLSLRVSFVSVAFKQFNVADKCVCVCMCVSSYLQVLFWCTTSCLHLRLSCVISKCFSLFSTEACHGVVLPSRPPPSLYTLYILFAQSAIHSPPDLSVLFTLPASRLIDTQFSFCFFFIILLPTFLIWIVLHYCCHLIHLRFLFYVMFD